MVLQSPNISFPFFIKKFTCDDQKQLANLAAGGDLFVHFYLHRMLKEKIELSKVDFSNLNILDYFIILTQYRQYYVGSGMNFQIPCEQCEHPIDLNFNISQHLTEIDTVFNLSHKTTLSHNGIKFEFDIPKINEIISFITTDYSDWIVFCLSKIDHTFLNTLSSDERKKIFDDLPSEVSHGITRLFNNLLKLKIPQFVKSRCSACKHELESDLNFGNMFGILKNIIMNFNYDHSLMELIILKKKIGLESEYISSISPIEKRRYLDIISDSQAEGKQESDGESQWSEQPNSEFGFE